MASLALVRTALVIAVLSLGGAVWYDMHNLVVRTALGVVELIISGLIIHWVLRRRPAEEHVARERRWPILAPVLAALFLRALWVAVAQTEPISDFKEYCDLGRHLAQTGVYGLEAPSAYRPPAISGVLAIFSLLHLPLATAAGLLNAVLGAATVPAVYLLAQQLSKTPAIAPQTVADPSHTPPGAAAYPSAELAAWLWALWPSQVLGSVLVATEPLFTACLLWAVVLTLRALQAPSRGLWLRWAVGAGVLFGLAGYVRSHALPVPWLWGALLLLQGRSGLRLLPRLAVVGVLTLLVMLPWGLRNQQQLGRFLITSTSSGVTMAYGNHQLATGRYDGDLPFTVPGATELEQFDSANTMAKAWITAHPLEFLLLVPQKWIALLAIETDEASYAMMTPTMLPAKEAAMFVCYLDWLLAKVLALGAVWRRRAQLEPAALTACAAILWTWLTIHALFHGQYRYHAPLLPIVLVLAAIALRPPRHDTTEAPL